MLAITVSNLQKTFQSKRKAAGLSGSLRSLVRPQYSTVEAVRGLSFEMEASELLGFIGSNGVGKSTTIKILTCVLFPTGGDAMVLGYQPRKERKQLAHHILPGAQRIIASPSLKALESTAFRNAA